MNTNQQVRGPRNIFLKSQPLKDTAEFLKGGYHGLKNIDVVVQKIIQKNLKVYFDVRKTMPPWEPRSDLPLCGKVEQGNCRLNGREGKLDQQSTINDKTLQEM